MFVVLFGKKKGFKNLNSIQNKEFILLPIVGLIIGLMLGLMFGFMQGMIFWLIIGLIVGLILGFRKEFK